MTVLRNGADVPEPVVTSTLIALEMLAGLNPVAFFEAVQLARDPGHVPFGNVARVLREYGLADTSGHLHGSARDVILACTEGDEESLHMVSPYAAGGAA